MENPDKYTKNPNLKPGQKQRGRGGHCQPKTYKNRQIHTCKDSIIKQLQIKTNKTTKLSPKGGQRNTLNRGVGGKIISRWRPKDGRTGNQGPDRKPDRLVPSPQKYPNSRQKGWNLTHFQGRGSRDQNRHEKFNLELYYKEDV